MKIRAGDVDITVVGDPHLGRAFLNGVPLHRRGERERIQSEEFIKQITPVGGVETIVIVGDLFDQFKVSNEVLMQTYDILHEFSMKNPAVDLVIMMGNHDVSRNKELKSSFEVLKTMCSQFGNIIFVTERREFRPRGSKYDILVCPYDAFTPTVEMYLEPGVFYSVVFGHWDTKSFGNDHNLMPLKLLVKHTDLIVNGHEHEKQTLYFDKNGNPVSPEILEETVFPTTTYEATGSMQPYNHGEDPSETLYVTRTVEQYLQDPGMYTNKCLRFLINKGEEPPVDVNALQVSYKYVISEEQEENIVIMEDFSFKTLFDECMSANSVSEPMQKQCWEVYKERNADVEVS